MNVSENEKLVKEITTKANQLAGLATGLMTIGYDIQRPAESILNESEVDHLAAIKAIGQLVQQLNEEIVELSEKLILAF